MSDVKWIKITTDLFDDEKILLIEELPDSDSLIVIWFKLLCLAGKQNNNGVFLLNDRIPYTEKMLATIFRRKQSTVHLALQAFEEFGMIEVINGAITIPNWDKHQNIDGLEKIREQTRERVQRHREKQKLLLKIEQCQYCGGQATGLDHIIATSKGGSNDDSNLVPCCIECNRIKNDKPLVDFLNNNRDRIKDDLIKNNPKLSRLVTLSNVTGRYEVTLCNAIEKNKKRSDQIRSDNTTATAGLSEAERDALDEFIKMRKAIKKPMTDRAIELLVNKLKGLSNDAAERVAILNQSIEHCWQTVYPLKDEKANSGGYAGKKNEFHNFQQHKYSDEDFKALERALDN